MKEKIETIKERIKKSNFYKMINLRSEISDLKGQISSLENENKALIDLVQIQKILLKTYKNNDIKVATYEVYIDQLKNELDKKTESNKKLTKKNKDLNKRNEELETQMFENDTNITSLKIQIEEYESQINDLKSDRYLVRKIPSGKTPNTNKTKISKPMSGRVTKYMRGEHE